MVALVDFASKNPVITAALITSLLAFVSSLLTLLTTTRQAAAAQRSAVAAVLTAQKAGARAIGALRQQ